MANGNNQPTPPPVRHVSLNITIQVSDIAQDKALELENLVRDLADDYGARTLANHGPVFVNPFGQ